MFAPPPAGSAALPRALRLAAQGARRRRRAQPARAARRHRAGRDARGDAFSHAGDRGPHRRHAGRRARAVSARAGRHPHHDARIAVSAAHVERARRAALGRDRHRRRDPRARPDQARRAPGAVARTARPRAAAQPLQRIGLSATQRPLDEVARFLGGAERRRAPAAAGRRRAAAAATRRRRSAGTPAPTLENRATSSPSAGGTHPLPAGHHRRCRERRSRWRSRIEVPVEDMAQARRPPTRSRAGPRRSATRGRPSGRPSIRGCSS